MDRQTVETEHNKRLTIDSSESVKLNSERDVIKTVFTDNGKRGILYSISGISGKPNETDVKNDLKWLDYEKQIMNRPEWKETASAHIEEEANKLAEVLDQPYNNNNPWPITFDKIFPNTVSHRALEILYTKHSADSLPNS